MSDERIVTGIRVGTWNDGDLAGVALRVEQDTVAVGVALLTFQDAVRLADDILRQVPSNVVEAYMAEHPVPQRPARPARQRGVRPLRHRVRS